MEGEKGEEGRGKKEKYVQDIGSIMFPDRYYH